MEPVAVKALRPAKLV